MTNPRSTSPQRGFTLMELMVTMAVLSIIMVMALQVTETARNAIRISEARALNDTIARRAFDPLAEDLGKILIREDARIEFESRPGNDNIAFLALRRGPSAGEEIGDREVSLIRYSMIDDPQEGPLFVRGALGYQFDGAGGDALVLNATAAFPTIPEGNFQSVSKNMLRFEVEYLVESANGITREVIAPDTSKDLRGVIITVATLDDRSLRGVGISRLPELASKFPDATAAENTLKAWTEIRDDLAKSGLGGYPKQALETLRCYQRTLLIP